MRLMNPRLCSECNDRDSDSDSVNRIYHYSAIYYHFQATLTEWKSPTRPLIMGGHFVAQCPFYFCVFIAFLSISNEDLTPDSGSKHPDAVHRRGTRIAKIIMPMMIMHTEPKIITAFFKIIQPFFTAR